MLLQKVHAILKKECNFPDDSRFLVGVSGGPDSVCLLDILSQLPYEIVVGHLDHNLRPSSNEEMDFVEKLADTYACKFVGKTVDILEISRINKTGIEETARKERYEFLFNSAKEERAAGVLVAHQADDQIETLLMNIIRGTGLEGMTGMRVRSMSEYNPDIPLVRPLLGIWREEILNYCQNHQLEFRLDESNQSMDHTRSRLRNRLIPELAQYNPNIKNSLLRTQQVLTEDFNFLEGAIASAIKDIGLTTSRNSVELKIEEYKKLPVSMQRLVIKEIFEKYFLDQNIISFSNIEYARRMFNREMKKSTLEISNQLFIYISEGKGILTTKRSGELGSGWPRIDKELTLSMQSGNYPLNEKWLLEIEEIPKDQVSEDIFKNQDPFTAFFDAKKINEKITIRSWKKGDSFKPLGMKGKSIKLSDFWINRKISPFARSDWPLVLNKDSIIWIPGLQQDHDTRIVNKTQKIIIMRLKSKP